MSYTPVIIVTVLIIAVMVALALMPNILARLEERRYAKRRQKRKKR